MGLIGEWLEAPLVVIDLASSNTRCLGNALHPSMNGLRKLRAEQLTPDKLQDWIQSYRPTSE